MGVEVDEVDNVTGCEGREELSERGVQRLRVLGGGFNGVGDGRELWVFIVRCWWLVVPSGCGGGGEA